MGVVEAFTIEYRWTEEALHIDKKNQDNNRKMGFQRRKESYSQLIGRAL